MRLRKGFSLVELVISLTLLGVILTSVFGVLIHTQKDYTRQREHIRSQDNMRVADVFIRTVLRSALADPRATRQVRIDADPDSTNNWDNIRVRSDFNPPDGYFDDPLEDVQMHVVTDSLMVRVQAGAPFEVYAYPVGSLKFEYYRKNGVQITNETEVALAQRIKFTLSAPNPAARDTVRRSTWVYLRNRR